MNISPQLQAAINSFFEELKKNGGNWPNGHIITPIKNEIHRLRLNLYVYPRLIRINDSETSRWYDASNYRTGLATKTSSDSYSVYVKLKERNKKSHQKAKERKKHRIITNVPVKPTWDYKPVIVVRNTSNGYYICKKSHPDRYDDTLYLREDGKWQNGAIGGTSPDGYYPTEAKALRMLLDAFKADPALVKYTIVD